MEKKESIERILENKMFLLETLSVEAKIILQWVHQKKLIPDRDYRNLSDCSQRENMIIDLLDKLMGRGEETCRLFIQLLKQEQVQEIFPRLKDHAVLGSSVLESRNEMRDGWMDGLRNLLFSSCVPGDLARVFRWLGFSLEQHRNKSAAEMRNILTDLGKRVDGDCFVCCVLSHGKDAGVYGTDGAVVSLNDIRTPFTGTSCPALAGKPKLFFIQACRGTRNQAVVMADCEDECEVEVDAVDFSVSIPSDTDFLIARSTIDGHLSYRNTDEGSWFIQSLCRNLETHCSQGGDIQSILLSVNNEVSALGLRSKQMPVHEVALRKKLILRPIHH
ncbi:hypothetical protein DNTS_025571 [Danionella cerebrum]|uniref:Caspase n=1 Tax=Danionella cerebrum TaxID=2873325 RepID=A0A553PYQ9_9TELE|nr:hypothetical protein DNTS_025571 [Danionella translucida]TRY82804.1 hypothetical protein DNTS_025571 [Danionella translucida]TRY82805.1 hypothetical protein DNTS_025571 [Danionella translucida]